MSRILRAIRSLSVAFFVGVGLSPVPAAAQATGRIVGRVSSAESGAAIPEVQVYLPSTRLGALTRQNGSFIILEVPPGSYELRAERIGLGSATQQVIVAAGQVVEANFQLATQALGLDEIVVTGTAGAARRREVGNSIAQLDVANIPDHPVKVGDMLQGGVAGINVGAVDGGVGNGQRITLRGNSSVSMSNQPIIYIDGVRMQSQQYPQVTSPDNRSNRGPNLTASPLNSINPSDIERIEVIKGSAATTLYGTEASAGVIQIFTKSGTTGAPVWTAETQQGMVKSRKFGPPSAPYMRMDPWLRRGFSQDYSASVRGGGENLRYFTSGAYSTEEGILPLDQGERWSVRGNFVYAPTPSMQMQWNSSYVHDGITTTPVGSSAEGLTLNAFRAERNYFGSADPKVIGEVLKWDMRTDIERFTTGGTVTYSPIPKLTNRLTIGYDFSEQLVNSLRPVGHFFWPLGALDVNTWQDRLLTFDDVATFSFNVTDAVSSNFSVGGQAVGDEIRMVEGWGESFPGAVAPTLSSAARTQAFQERQRVWNAGFFFQNIFGFVDRYFLTVGLRVDGNSAFGSGFGLQMYPKASASWVVSDESFWQDGWGSLKLRSAYGQSGRAPGAFDAVRTWQGTGWNGNPSFAPRNVGNPDLGPEVSAEFELGFDGSFLGDRLTSMFTYYNQTTSDALFRVSQIPSNGFLESQLLNVGRLKNTGMELTLNGALLQQADWGVDMGVNLSTNHSKVADLGGAPAFSLGSSGWVVEGQPAPVIRTRRITNPDAAEAPKWEADYNWGPNAPTLTVAPSLSLRLPYGISLSTRGEYRGGHFMEVSVEAGGVTRSARVATCYPYYVDPEKAITLKADTPALWRARCTPSLNSADWYIYDADFFRLRSVSATIPMDFAFPDGVDRSTLTLSLNESYTWHNSQWDYMDPEMQGNRGAHEQVVSPGYRVPVPISFRAALQVQF